MSSPQPSDYLTEDQRRHLTAGLVQIEQALRRILAIARQPAPGMAGLVDCEAEDLPPGFTACLVAPVADAAATLAELVAAFQLIPPATSRRRSIQALVLSSMVITEDCASSKLRGYGPVHPNLSEVLDPMLARLRQHLSEIGRSLPRPARTAEVPT
jgi:hypothetical protein